MLTILQSINLSAEYLGKKGVDDPRRNAEILLCKVLNCKKINLYLNFDRPLSEDEVIQYRTLLKRRGEREPIQYITGSVEFFSMNFKVNPSVLIPRPETELLVEKVINDYKDIEISLLDIGTGSGNIAVSISANLPKAKVTGIDKSETALKTAAENSLIHGCGNRINFIKADILQTDIDKLVEKYDVIVSNPPYISEKDYQHLEPELIVYEPKMALSDCSDGLTFYKRIADLSEKLLNKKGKIYLEIGQGQSDKVRDILGTSFINISITKDYQGIDRIVTGEKS